MSASIALIVVSSAPSEGAAPEGADELLTSARASGFDVLEVTRVGDESIAAKVNDLIFASDSEFFSVVESRGWLSDDAGSALMALTAAHPEADIFYTDEGVVSRGRVRPVLKPIFSPERLRNQSYLGDIVLYRRSLLVELGGLDPLMAGAELYDLELRASRVARAVEHLAAPLFLRSADLVTALSYVALDSTRRALQRHLDATGGGEVRAVGADGVHDTRRLVDGQPLISIVIPSRGTHSEIAGESRCYVLDAVQSITEKSTYANYELVIVLDSVAEPAVIDALRTLAGDKLHLVEWDRPFNFSEKINEGVLNSSGDYVLLLNDDVRVIDDDWLEALLALAQRPNAGMSGGMLYFEDETIQHAGHGYFDGDASHIGLDAPRADPGPLQGYRVEREVSGVTAACAMMPRSVFYEVGGLSNLLPGNFNDVDLCMKVTWLGYDIYWTPHAELYHFESKTRDASVHAFEVDVAWGRWGFRMHDPRYWPYPHNRPPV
ncbi:hypothetical protein BH09ACT1_BH09ACT1_02460 [soil metagenome]